MMYLHNHFLEHSFQRPPFRSPAPSSHPGSRGVWKRSKLGAGRSGALVPFPHCRPVTAIVLRKGLEVPYQPRDHPSIRCHRPGKGRAGVGEHTSQTCLVYRDPAGGTSPLRSGDPAASPLPLPAEADCLPNRLSSLPEEVLPGGQEASTLSPRDIFARVFIVFDVAVLLRKGSNKRTQVFEPGATTQFLSPRRLQAPPGRGSCGDEGRSCVRGRHEDTACPWNSFPGRSNSRPGCQRGRCAHP